MRDIVTDVVTGQRRGAEAARGPRQVKEKILGGIHTRTDVRSHEVLFPDVAVQ